jgi:Leucine-rich repeat (LRR) protein
MKGLTQLDSLNLEHNRLQHIAVPAFQHVPELTHLTLSHNRLSLIGTESPDGEVQSVLSPCLKLVQLRIVNNSVTTIFYDWAWSLLNLQTLDLSFNLISRITVSTRDFTFSPQRR